MSSNHPARRQGALLLAIASLIVFAVSPALGAAFIRLSQASAAPGQSVEVCFSLENGNDEIAGVQMDVTFDASCASADLKGGRPRCRSNPDTGKTVQSAMPAGSTLRAIMLNVADVSPIPDGELFCCDFIVDSRPSESACPLSLSGLMGASSRGDRLPISGSSGVIYTSAAPDSGDNVRSGIDTSRRSGSNTGGSVGTDLDDNVAPSVDSSAPSNVDRDRSGGNTGAAPAGKAAAPPAPDKQVNNAPRAAQPFAPSGPGVHRDDRIREEAEREAGRAQVEENLRNSNRRDIGDDVANREERLDDGDDAPVAAAADDQAQASAPTATRRVAPSTSTSTPKPTRTRTATPRPTRTPTAESGFLGGCHIRRPSIRK